jgi:hypothetical protein
VLSVSQNSEISHCWYNIYIDVCEINVLSNYVYIYYGNERGLSGINVILASHTSNCISSYERLIYNDTGARFTQTQCVFSGFKFNIWSLTNDIDTTTAITQHKTLLKKSFHNHIDDIIYIYIYIYIYCCVVCDINTYRVYIYMYTYTLSGARLESIVVLASHTSILISTCMTLIIGSSWMTENSENYCVFLWDAELVVRPLKWGRRKQLWYWRSGPRMSFE